jgi:hypothetical protein
MAYLRTLVVASAVGEQRLLCNGSRARRLEERASDVDLKKVRGHPRLSPLAVAGSPQGSFQCFCVSAQQKARQKDVLCIQRKQDIIVVSHTKESKFEDGVAVFPG